MKQRTVLHPNLRKLVKNRPLREPAPRKRGDARRVSELRRPRIHGCPGCGLNRGLGELDLIPGLAYGRFDENGVWQFEGETKVFWDDQRQEHEPARFVCLNCDTVFDLSGRIY
jgi:hypothetical protein